MATQRSSQPLPPKLEAVLIRLTKDAPLSITQVVKLPYLIDVVANHILGRPITEGQHQTWKYGVVTSEAYNYLNEIEDDADSAFQVKGALYSDQREVRAVRDPAPVLTLEEERIVALVLQQYSDERATELGTMTKRMNPDVTSWGNKRPADIGPDAYDRMSDDYQAMAAEAERWSLDRLLRESVEITSPEEAIA
jgi:uncharacterized phage-associated protein